MSPNDPRQMGDLEDLPECAPAGLKGLHALAEVAIQEQIELLGSGTPSKAPDLRELLREEGIAEPEHRSTMVDKYTEYQDEVRDVKNKIQRIDTVNDARTAEIGGVVKKAYNDIGAAVEELNDLITDSYKGVRSVPDEDGKRTYYLLNETINGLVKGIWKALNTTYHEVKGVSDKAAAEALKIVNDQPSYPTTRGNGGPAVSYGNGGYGNAGSNNTLFGGYTGSHPNDESYRGPASEEDYARYQGNMSIDRAIEGALDALGITDPEARENWIRGYRVLILRESSGDPNKVNNWDSNAAKGQNSRGLTQTIPSTFEAYHQPGTSNNIYDPVANVAASMNYVMDRYNVRRDGSNLQEKVQQADPNRDPLGY